MIFYDSILVKWKNNNVKIKSRVAFLVKTMLFYNPSSVKWKNNFEKNQVRGCISHENNDILQFLDTKAEK